MSSVFWDQLSISEHLLRVVPVATLRRQCDEVEIFRLWWQLHREQWRSICAVKQLADALWYKLSIGFRSETDRWQTFSRVELRHF